MHLGIFLLGFGFLFLLLNVLFGFLLGLLRLLLLLLLLLLRLLLNLLDFFRGDLVRFSLLNRTLRGLLLVLVRRKHLLHVFG